MQGRRDGAKFFLGGDGRARVGARNAGARAAGLGTAARMAAESSNGRRPLSPTTTKMRRRRGSRPRTMHTKSIRCAVAAAAIWSALSCAGQAAPNPQAFAAYQKGDYAAALKLLLPQATAGDPDAQYSVGAMYNNALGVEADHASAARWFARSAAKGNVHAQADLALALA